MGAASKLPKVTCGQCNQEVTARDGVTPGDHRCPHGHYCTGRSNSCSKCYRERYRRPVGRAS